MAASNFVIYHNPRCGKSRQALQLIRDAGHEPQIVEYLKTPLTAAELNEVLKKLKLTPQQVMRKGEPIFKELRLAERELAREEAIQVLVEHPILLERPIVVHGAKAMLGRPPENISTML